MPSHRANRYGTLAERYLADERGLRRDGEHTSWCDARFQKLTRPDRLSLGSLWSPTGGHRDSEKAKVAISRIF